MSPLKRTAMPRRKKYLSGGGAPKRGGTPALKRRGIKPKKRNPSEFARIYGSRERVAFVKALPCVVCGHGPCDNAHIVGGGMGRKADYDQIIPLCCMSADHPWSPGYARGHHGLLHSVGVKTFTETYRLDLAKLAAQTESRWQEFSAGAARGRTR